MKFRAQQTHGARSSDTLAAMLLSFVMPTRNRSRELAFTLEQLGMLDLESLGGESEVVIVDNGSESPIDLPERLSNSIAVIRVGLDENLGTGARNIGAQHAKGRWIIMLDDDSNLMPGEVGAYLSGLDSNVAAVGGEILLPTGRHEAGGLPEVIVGCGCAIRRDVFLEVGGYDTGFGYYAEEYDLCAKLIADGYRIGQTRAIGFEHRKCAAGRNMDEILYRLVRNNGWVIQRYAPAASLTASIDEMLMRYERIAINESAVDGYRRGVRELESTICDQMRSPLDGAQWDRFIGLDAMERCLGAELANCKPSAVVIVGGSHGKGLGLIRGLIESQGIEILDSEAQADALSVIGTLSPGPMLDGQIEFPDALSPWLIEEMAQIGSQS